MSATGVHTEGIPAVGTTATRSRTLRQSDIARFTEITGDRNPLHYDEGLAAAKHHVRHPGTRDFADDTQCLARIEFVLEPLSRRRFGAAVQACEIAVPRQLPRDEKRSAQLIDTVHPGRSVTGSARTEDCCSMKQGSPR